MKRLIAIVISLLIGTSIVFAYTTTVTVKGVGVEITTETGNNVQLTPKISEISGWNVVTGNTTVTNNEFTMPQGDVEIEAIINEPVAMYELRIETPLFTKIESYEEGESVTVEAISGEDSEFSAWTANGITLTAEQKTSSTITFTMPSQPVILEAIYEIISLEWDTTGQLAKTLKLKTTNETIIDWGDGIKETYPASPSEEQTVSHTYTTEGNYTVKLGGNNNITFLACTYNQINALDISRATNLSYLNLGNNLVTQLELSSNTALVKLVCYYNNLTALNIDNNTNLTYVDCGGNPNIGTLNVSNNINLETLSCYNNGLTSLDVSNNTKLKLLYCYSMGLRELDLTNNTELVELKCQNNSLNSLTIINAPKLEILYCGNNQLTGLNLATSPLLRELQCYINKLTGLNLANNSNITFLDCGNNNNLGTLNLTNNTKLKHLSCYSCGLSTLDLTANTELTHLTCSWNLIQTLELSNKPNLATVYCGGNRLTSLNISNNMLLNKMCCTQSTLQTLYINTTQNTNMNIIDEATCHSSSGVTEDNTIHKYTTTNISVVNN